jgi:pyruvate ferredoxin oxidoreductase alpha subunit
VNRTLLTGNAAAAWGARLARADYLPAFPITPQTEIIESIARWIGEGAMTCRMVTLESEHSMITAAGAAAATGVRVFTATSSQGLLHGMEMLYTVAGWRVPFVMVNVSRGLAAPITLEPDHNDILAARDSGFLQLHCATCQEVADMVLLAYRLAEDPQVRLPVIVNMDGFYLSFTREPVDLLTPEQADRFLPPFDPGPIEFRSGKPTSQAVAVLGGSAYSYFRYETHLAALDGLDAFEAAAASFGELTGRNYGPLELYRADDADVVFVMIGSFATKAKAAIKKMRNDGLKVGLVRPRLLRPFPEAAIRRALADKRAVAVIDQNLSPGRGGILHGEIAASLQGGTGMPGAVSSFVGGLGGRDISQGEFAEIAATALADAERGEKQPARLLYTKQELAEMRKLQAVAHVERTEDLAKP